MAKDQLNTSVERSSAAQRTEDATWNNMGGFAMTALAMCFKALKWQTMSLAVLATRTIAASLIGANAEERIARQSALHSMQHLFGSVERVVVERTFVRGGQAGSAASCH